MRYQGGKERIAKHIAEILIGAGDGRSTYIEPFLGGASVFARVAPRFERAIGADVVPDVALLWDAAARGWRPPTELSREEYATLRHAEPSALRAFAGFGCSFGGKWFGGYAKHSPGHFTVAGQSAVVIRKAAGLAHAEIRHADYRELSDVIGPDSVVYCDPPYADTLAYTGAGAFDSAAFWDTASAWARAGAAVFVSEYAAPAGWRAAWERTKRVSMRADNNATTAIERLFTFDA